MSDTVFRIRTCLADCCGYSVLKSSRNLSLVCSISAAAVNQSLLSKQVQTVNVETKKHKGP